MQTKIQIKVKTNKNNVGTELQKQIMRLNEAFQIKWAFCKNIAKRNSESVYCGNPANRCGKCAFSKLLQKPDETLV